MKEMNQEAFTYDKHEMGWEVWEDSKGNIMDVCPDCAKLQRD